MRRRITLDSRVISIATLKVVIGVIIPKIKDVVPYANIRSERCKMMIQASLPVFTTELSPNS
jgi:hypothetical protein